MEKLITLKKAKRQRKHGFMAKMASHGGRKVLKARRTRGRKNISL